MLPVIRDEQQIVISNEERNLLVLFLRRGKADFSPDAAGFEMTRV